VILWDYAQARRYGATHAECMEVIVSQANLGYYAWDRQRGYTHSEAVEAALR